MVEHRIPRCLTIAGSDSGGGAGIQGDLKTFTVLGAYGMTVITALTAQNTLGVSSIETVSPEFVRRQMQAVLEDIGCDAAKTGMLASAAIVDAVADELENYPDIPLVVDPVMVSTSGAQLLEPEAIDGLIRRLLPRATIVTPNAPEAEILSGYRIDSLDAAIRAARAILKMGAGAVLLKGGDATYSADHVDDIFASSDGVEILTSARIATPHTHGSGCALSSALCVGLAHGWPVDKAVAMARQFIHRAIAHAQPLGRGHGPVNHLRAALARAED